jgi:acetyltransferase
MGELERLFAPERVAVVGATDEEGSVGKSVTENLLAEFDGTVLAVNPNRESVLGLSCYDDVGELAGVDLAVVVVPAAIAVEVVRKAAEAGIENVVVITAGFSEAGGEGATRERELVTVAERNDLNLVGPNCIGVMSSTVGLNATFAPTSAGPGSISFMSQSGAFITAVLGRAAERDLGFRDVVSLGNKAVLDERDFLTHWGVDSDTDVILCYLEDIADGRGFINAAREVSQETPIVAVKSGRTDEGASAAASHTGAIAGSDKAYEAGLSQAGVIRVDSVEELFDFASILASQPVPDDAGVAIVTNAGGPGVMTTDAVGDAAVCLAEFTDQTLERLGAFLPTGANIYNPVDIIGDASAERFARTIEVVLEDEDVGTVVVLACPTATLDFDELATETARLHEEFDAPIAATLMGGSSTRSARKTLRAVGIPTYFDPERAVRSLEALARYREISRREYVQPERFDVDRGRARAVLTAAAEGGRRQLGVESMELLEAYGIPTPAGGVVDSPDEAAELAGDIDGNVVMKIVSPAISHKSDIGGVEVGVSTEAVADVYEDIVARARNYRPDATILGVQIQEEVDVDAGTETIVGVNRDPQFGPLVLFGLGGIFVEIMDDTAFRIAPVSRPESREMIDEVVSSPLLYGARGRKPANVDELVEVVQRVSQLVTDFPAITELDLNPVVAMPDGAVAIDLQLTLDYEKL